MMYVYGESGIHQFIKAPNNFGAIFVLKKFADLLSERNFIKTVSRVQLFLTLNNNY